MNYKWKSFYILTMIGFSFSTEIHVLYYKNNRMEKVENGRIRQKMKRQQGIHSKMYFMVACKKNAFNLIYEVPLKCCKFTERENNAFVLCGMSALHVY